MSKLFSRWMPCATLLAWGSILLYFFFSGRVVDALHPMFRPGVVIAGGLMLLLAAVFIFAAVETDPCHDEACSQPLARLPIGKFLTFAILILPVTAATVVSPRGFSATTVLNRGIALDAKGLTRPAQGPVAPAAPTVPAADEPALPTKDGLQPPVSAAPAGPTGPDEQFLTKTPEGHLAVQVIDLLFAAQDPSLRQIVENKTVELVGQMMPDTVSNAKGNRFKLVRMFMVCCAADSRPMAALIEGQQAPGVAEMGWVKVVGTATFPLEGGRMVAVVKADTVASTAPPEETMLY